MQITAGEGGGDMQPNQQDIDLHKMQLVGLLDYFWGVAGKCAN